MSHGTMAVKRLQRSPSDGIQNVDDLIGYLRQHPDTEELACEQAVSDQHVQAIDRLLYEQHSAIHLSSIQLPRNSLTQQTGQPLQRILYTQSQSLVRLDLSHNPLTSAGVNLVLQPLIENSCALLRYLDLSNTHIKTKDASIIKSLLQHNTTLQELHIAHNNIGAKGIKTLAPVIASNNTLRVLNLSQNNLTAGGIAVLAKALHESQTWQLVSLDVSNNRIGTKGIDKLAEFLLFDRQLQRLDVSNNNLNIEGAASMASVIKLNYTLRDIQLANNQIGDIGASLILDSVQHNSTLQHLNLSGNQLGTESAIALAEQLTKNVSLVSLDLSTNLLSCEGVSALARALEFNLTLKDINLKDNRIENEGAFALSLTLSKPSSRIEHVDWAHNPIADEGLASLRRIPRIKRNHKTWLGTLLKDINKKSSVNMNLTEKNIGDEEVLLLSNALAENQPTVRSLYLEGATISSRSLVPFAEAVLRSRSSKIERLYVRNTALGDAGAMAIGKALRRNASLQVLVLSKCGISCDGANVLAEGIAVNSSLRRLNLDRNFITDEGFISILAALSLQPRRTPGKRSSLQSISASYNQLTDRVFASENNGWKYLKELHLNGNPDITDRGVLSLCSALMSTEKQSEAQMSLLSLRGTQVTGRGASTIQSWLGRDAMIDY